MAGYKTTIKKIFRAKSERRMKLARLPIEKKVRILLQLQKMAAPVYRSSGINKKPWIIAS